MGDNNNYQCAGRWWCKIGAQVKFQQQWMCVFRMLRTEWCSISHAAHQHTMNSSGTLPPSSSHLGPDQLLSKLLQPIRSSSPGTASLVPSAGSRRPAHTFPEPYVPSQYEIKCLLSSLKPILYAQSNVIRISTPVVVVGDLHGQYFDFLELLLTTGMPPHVNMLFLGDIVDRGYYSIQTLCLVLSLMLKYPERVHLIRGNHESESISKVYGFYEECCMRYGDNAQVYSWFTEIFNLLPIACTVGETLFAVHGGLSPSIESVDQIKVLDRFRDVPTEGAFADLLWSDPGENLDSGFAVSSRGAGFLFAEDVLQHFLHLNRFEHLTRAHQLAHEGYRVYWNDKMSTIWSAPNYTYRCKNLASVMSVDDEGRREFVVFQEAPHALRSVPKSKRRSHKNESMQYFS